MRMNEYPQNLIEFENRFSTEQSCRDYLFQLRWSTGFCCPRCGHSKAWPSSKDFLFKCANCNYKTSVIAGTIFQDTHIPLTIWFRAMWLITSQKNGASALNLQQVLGFGSYKTAWSLLHKLRRAMVRPGRDQLFGTIEVDETYIGGHEEGKRGRKIEKKSLVVIAAQEDGRNIGRIRMKRIQNASAQNLQPFIVESVKQGSIIHTDGWEGYTGLENKGYTHKITIIKKSKESASNLLPRVHRVSSLLKRWLTGTHQGSVSKEHLDYYLDEFTFRFNRRASRYRGKLFYRLVQQAVSIEPTPYSDMVQHVRGLRQKKA
jgi:transposase-like protein